MLSTVSTRLTEDQIEFLRRFGQTSKVQAGQVLVRAGDPSCDFVVVLEDEVEVIDDFAGEARTMGLVGAGSFVGELNLLTGQALYLSAVAREGGKALSIPRKRLKEVVAEELARRSTGLQRASPP